MFRVNELEVEVLLNIECSTLAAFTGVDSDLYESKLLLISCSLKGLKGSAMSLLIL